MSIAGDFRQPRLAGVDLMRAVAAFAVIGIHAGLVVHNHTTDETNYFQEAFGFAVPFFLITAFFFALVSQRGGMISWRRWGVRNASRFLVPFAFWSMVYFVLRVAKFCWSRDDTALQGLLGDPGALVLSGGSSVALYFLPLLFVGLGMCRWFGPALGRLPIWTLGILLVLTIVLAESLDRSGNAYNLATSRGFETLAPVLNEFSPLRITLALLAHALRDLPFLLMAALVFRFWSKRMPKSVVIVGLAIMAISIAFHWRHGPNPEVFGGLGALLVGLGLSCFMQSSSITAVLGEFSFGIYLVHQVVLEAMQLIVERAHSEFLMTVPLFVMITSLAFIVAALIVAVAVQCGKWPRRFFGLPDATTLPVPQAVSGTP